MIYSKNVIKIESLHFSDYKDDYNSHVSIIRLSLIQKFPAKENGLDKLANEFSSN